MGEKLPFAKKFKDLLVYQRAYALSLTIHKISLDFPQKEQFGGIADQMRRASKGICANIAEGHGKNNFPAEWRRFLMMALGSCQEMQVWTQYAVDLGYIERALGREWWKNYEELVLMIQSLLVKSKDTSRKKAA